MVFCDVIMWIWSCIGNVVEYGSILPVPVFPQDIRVISYNGPFKLRGSDYFFLPKKKKKLVPNTVKLLTIKSFLVLNFKLILILTQNLDIICI